MGPSLETLSINAENNIRFVSQINIYQCDKPWRHKRNPFLACHRGVSGASDCVQRTFREEGANRNLAAGNQLHQTGTFQTGSDRSQINFQVFEMSEIVLARRAARETLMLHKRSGTPKRSRNGKKGRSKVSVTQVNYGNLLARLLRSMFIMHHSHNETVSRLRFQSAQTNCSYNQCRSLFVQASFNQLIKSINYNIIIMSITIMNMYTKVIKPIYKLASKIGSI